MISAVNVSKRFGRIWALRDVTLEVSGGETLVVFGANGAGKTTLLRVVSGLMRPTSGAVAIDGGDPRAHRARIGYLGHDPYVYPHLSAAENLAFFARLYGVPAARADEALERVELAAKQDWLVWTLSRGEVQRVALARAVLHDPEVLLVDEPFAGLDEASAASLPGLLKREGRTLVVATHDVERGKAIADETATLEAGRLR